LDAAILSSFAVFRRSALSRDELSGLKSGGDGLDRELSKVYELSGYYPAYVRRLTRGLDGRRPFAAIDAGGRVFQANALTRGPTVELVPDGVASVRIAYRERPAIVVPVSENAFSFTPPPATPRVEAELRRLEPAIVATHLSQAQRRRSTLQWDKALDGTDPTRLEWLNSVGRLVRAINAPTAGRNSVTSVGNLRAPIGG
jgi:hypothetical protein